MRASIPYCDEFVRMIWMPKDADLSPLDGRDQSSAAVEFVQRSRISPVAHADAPNRPL